MTRAASPRRRNGHAPIATLAERCDAALAAAANAPPSSAAARGGDGAAAAADAADADDAAADAVAAAEVGPSDMAWHFRTRPLHHQPLSVTAMRVDAAEALLGPMLWPLLRSEVTSHDITQVLGDVI